MGVKEFHCLRWLDGMIDSMDVPSQKENPLFEIWHVDEYGYIGWEIKDEQNMDN